MTRKKDERQTTIPGTAPEEGPRPLTVAQVIARVIDIERSTAIEAERAAQIARARYQDRALEKRSKLLGRLPSDEDRALAERMLIAALSAMRSVAREAKEAEQLEIQAANDAVPAATPTEA